VWVVLTAVLLTGAPRAAFAQAVTDADIQRVGDDIETASTDVGRLPSGDAALRRQLQADLDEARDDATYLRVKLRKGEPVTQRELTELRSKVQTVHARARNAVEPPAAAGTSGAASTSARAVAVGTELDVRLQDPLSSATSMVEDRFEATTLVDLKKGDDVLIPAGSIVRGVVSSVKKAGRLNRKGEMTVAFDQLTIRGRSYPIRATVTEAIESEGIRGETGKIGVGAGVGAIVGGILGGFKGALAGILIGAGGTIAATEGEDVDLPVGTVLRVRVDSEIDLR
jgi:hypothetical protein